MERRRSCRLSSTLLFNYPALNKLRLRIPSRGFFKCLNSVLRADVKALYSFINSLIWLRSAWASSVQSRSRIFVVFWICVFPPLPIIFFPLPILFPILFPIPFYYPSFLMTLCNGSIRPEGTVLWLLQPYLLTQFMLYVLILYARGRTYSLTSTVNYSKVTSSHKADWNSVSKVKALP